MGRISTWAIPISLLLLLVYSVSSEEEDVRHSLVGFLRKLAGNDTTEIDRKLGWDANSDPCKDGWTGVDCDKAKNKVRHVVLEGLELGGPIDARLLCSVQSLTVVSLRDNAIQGELPVEISKCAQLTRLYVGGNRLTGRLPSSLALLNNLKRLNISNNNFSGDLPDLSPISGLQTFLAQNNQFTGPIPHFDFTNFNSFNVSNNLLSGPVPVNGDLFGIDCFMGNLDLCGKPLPNACPPTPPSPPEENKRKKNPIADKVIMYLGYIILGLVILILLAYKLIYRRKTSKNKGDGEKKVEETNNKPSNGSSAYKTGASGSEYSLTPSGETAATLTSLVVLQNPATNELRFEDLLKAPAELLGRGRLGSLYKVMLQDGTALAVKRIKDLSDSPEDFRRRMKRIDRVKHANLLPPIAFYCSTQEKLVVYEYQKNGSLFKLLHDSTKTENFNWRNRLNVAAGIAEGLALMHHELKEDAIGHGNLKSSNILMKTDMNPCISEYGLTSTAINNNHDISPLSSGSEASNGNKLDVNDIQCYTLKADVYGFGVILLELLTAKVVQNNGADLARWVHSVVREEWTVEVFDKALLSGGASEARMVHLLQLALKCINSNPDARPSMGHVAATINAIKEEEEGEGEEEEEEETSIVSET